MGEIQTVFPSCGLFTSVSIQFTTVGSLKIHVALCAASVRIYCDRIIRRAYKVPLLAATPSAFIWSIDGMTTEMISRMSRLINNVYG